MSLQLVRNNSTLLLQFALA